MVDDMLAEELLAEEDEDMYLHAELEDMIMALSDAPRGSQCLF
jgi:hypothetical protein